MTYKVTDPTFPYENIFTEVAGDLAAMAKSKETGHYRHPKDLLMLLELEAIQEGQLKVRSKEE